MNMFKCVKMHEVTPIFADNWYRSSDLVVMSHTRCQLRHVGYKLCVVL